MIAVMNVLSRWAIPIIILFIFCYATYKKVDIYAAFIEGASEGFKIAIQLIPYLIAMMVAIGLFRSSGAMDIFSKIISPITSLVGIPSEIIPLAILRPLSGGGALGVSAELIHNFGPDSFIGRLASTMQGSSDTTFFVLTLYFGSVGIKKYRHALPMGLLADFTTFIASVCLVRLFFQY